MDVSVQGKDRDYEFEFRNAKSEMKCQPQIRILKTISRVFSCVLVLG